MDGAGDTENKFVEGLKLAKEPSKDGTNNDGSNEIPKEEHENTLSSGVAFAPGDTRMEEEGEDGGQNIGDDAIEPEEFVGIKNDTS